jgi:hypothetical protein
VLTKLRELSLSHAEITSEGMRHLAKLHNLERLILGLDGAVIDRKPAKLSLSM